MYHVLLEIIITIDSFGNMTYTLSVKFKNVCNITKFFLYSKLHTT